MFGETPTVNQLLPDLSVLSIKTRVVASVPVLSIRNIREIKFFGIFSKSTLPRTQKANVNP